MTRSVELLTLVIESVRSRLYAAPDPKLCAMDMTRPAPLSRRSRPPVGAEAGSRDRGGSPHTSLTDEPACEGGGIPANGTGVVGIVTARSRSRSPDSRDRGGGRPLPIDPARPSDPLPDEVVPESGLGGAGRMSDPDALAAELKKMSVLLDVLRAGLIAPSVSGRGKVGSVYRSGAT